MGNNLPSGYKELQYIESTGTTTGRQYIDTGYTGKTGMKALVKFMWLDGNIGNDRYVLGASDSNRIYFGTYQSKWMYGNGAYKQATGIEQDVIYTAEVDWTLNNQHLIVNDTEIITDHSSTEIDTGCNMYLFSRNNSGSYTSFSSIIRMYSCKLWEDGTLVRNYIPCKNSSDVAGMYDLVTDTFFQSETSTAFTPGPETVYTVRKKCYASRIIPSTYTPLEYIQSSGTQHIDTGVKCTSTAYYDITFAFMESTASKALYGAVEGSQANDLQISQIRVGNTDCLGTTLTVGQKYNFKWDSTGCYLDGTSTGKTPGSGFPTSNNIYLFRANSTITTYYGSGKIYNCKMYNDTTLVRNFIPAKRNSDSVLGMYDTVTNTFFTNSGTGTFTAGPEVSAYTITEVKKSCYASRIIPSTYTPLEYIQSSRTQYIDTGYKLVSSTDTVSITVENLETGSNLWNFGCYPAPMFGFSTGTYGSSNNIGYNSLHSDTTHTYQTGKHIWLADSNGLSIDGTHLYDYASFTSSYNIYLFAICNSGSINNYSSCKIYNYKQTRDGALVINFIPAKRNSDNEIGMYDLVNDVFYTNAGTGTFTAGPEVSQYTITEIKKTNLYIGGSTTH